ncbi:MAG: hypothetical protein QOF03_1637, partial [Alphaproteobacteria bacterium]|nr:hypothetical protein [Alphaproteobacteria bacterium]
LKCRAPRVPALGIADYVPLSPTTGNLAALCSTCTTIMHKAISLAALAALAGIVEVTVRQASKHLSSVVTRSHHKNSIWGLVLGAGANAS